MRKAAVYFQLKVVMEDKQAIENSGPAIFAMVCLDLENYGGDDDYDYGNAELYLDSADERMHERRFCIFIKVCLFICEIGTSSCATTKYLCF